MGVTLLAVLCCNVFNTAAFLLSPAPRYPGLRASTCDALLSVSQSQGHGQGSVGREPDLVDRRRIATMLLVGLLVPDRANAEAAGTSATRQEQNKENRPDSKVRRASSGKNVLRDDFCPDPKPGQAILMNCQKAKLKRAKLAKGKNTDGTAKPESAQKAGK